MDHPLLWILLTLPLTFVAIWCGVMRLLADASGWRRLAESYATDREPGDVARRWQSANLNGVGFNNALTLEPAAEGLYLKMGMPLSRGFRPLLVPWSDVTPIEQKKTFTQGEVLVLELGKPKGVRLTAPAWLLGQLPGGAATD